MRAARYVALNPYGRGSSSGRKTGFARASSRIGPGPTTTSSRRAAPRRFRQPLRRSRTVSRVAVGAAGRRTIGVLPPRAAHTVTLQRVLFQERPHLPRPARSANARFLAFSARTVLIG